MDGNLIPATESVGSGVASELQFRRHSLPELESPLPRSRQGEGVQRQIDPGVAQAAQQARDVPGGGVGPGDAPVLKAGLAELEDVLQGDGLALEARDLGDLGHTPRLVGHQFLVGDQARENR